MSPLATPASTPSLWRLCNTRGNTLTVSNTRVLQLLNRWLQDWGAGRCGTPDVEAAQKAYDMLFQTVYRPGKPFVSPIDFERCVCACVGRRREGRGSTHLRRSPFTGQVPLVLFAAGVLPHCVSRGGGSPPGLQRHLASHGLGAHGGSCAAMQHLHLHVRVSVPGLRGVPLHSVSSAVFALTHALPRDRYDLVNVAREWLSMAPCLEAYDAVDPMSPDAELKSQVAAFLEVTADVDAMMATDSGFLLGLWLKSSREVSDWDGSEGKLADFYEWNSRVQITTWAGGYSRREWSGMVNSYYGECSPGAGPAARYCSEHIASHSPDPPFPSATANLHTNARSRCCFTKVAG